MKASNEKPLSEYAIANARIFAKIAELKKRSKEASQLLKELKKQADALLLPQRKEE